MVPKLVPKWCQRRSLYWSCTQELPGGAPGVQNGPQNGAKHVSKSCPEALQEPRVKPTYIQNGTPGGMVCETSVFRLIVMDPGPAKCAKRFINNPGISRDGLQNDREIHSPGHRTSRPLLSPNESYKIESQSVCSRPQSY